jgi:hypothetical protein
MYDVGVVSCNEMLQQVVQLLLQQRQADVRLKVVAV